MLHLHILPYVYELFWELMDLYVTAGYQPHYLSDLFGEAQLCMLTRLAFVPEASSNRVVYVL